MSVLKTSFVVLASVLALGGCAVQEEIDEEFDCHNLCDRYRDCYDTSYDVGACYDRCQGYVDNVGPGRADMCDACLDPRSCVEVAFECTSECNGIIP